MNVTKMKSKSKLNLIPVVIYASDLFKGAADAAAIAHAQHAMGNQALADNQLRHALRQALVQHKGKLAFNVPSNRFEVQFGKRDSYIPEGTILHHLRAMEERDRKAAIAKPHPVRKAA